MSGLHVASRLHCGRLPIYATKVRLLCRRYIHTNNIKLADGDLENIRSMFDLKGKSYVVTGGARGIGYAAVRSIAEMGGNVCVLDTLPKPVDDFYRLRDEFQVETVYLNADVTKAEDIHAGFEEAANQLGSVDGCVATAGVAIDKPFMEYSWDDVRKIMDVNVTGTFFTAQHAAQHMIRQGTGGSIVLMASICGSTTVPGHKLSAYHSSKGAVKMLNTALSVELAQHSIRVNSISPGYIESDMTRRLREEVPELVELMHTAPPLGRIGNRNDLTGAVIYLLSDVSRYTSGAEIMITGALHAGRS